LVRIFAKDRLAKFSSIDRSKFEQDYAPMLLESASGDLFDLTIKAISQQSIEKLNSSDLENTNKQPDFARKNLTPQEVAVKFTQLT